MSHPGAVGQEQLQLQGEPLLAHRPCWGHVGVIAWDHRGPWAAPFPREQGPDTDDAGGGGRGNVRAAAACADTAAAMAVARDSGDHVVMGEGQQQPQQRLAGPGSSLR